MKPLAPFQRRLTMGTTAGVERDDARDHRLRRRGEMSGRETASAGLGLRRRWIWLGVVVALVAGSGCQLLKTTTEMPGKAMTTIAPGQKGKGAVDPVVVQETLLRVADMFSTSMVLGAEKLRHGTNAPDPAEILQWKIAFVSETCSIASGANAVANLLDLTVLVSVTRAAVEDYWQPKVFGESARAMLQGCRNAETNVWQVAGGVLTGQQQAQLHQAIERWRGQNPLPENVLAARAVGIASAVVKSDQARATTPAGLFEVLNLDPLSGLDPATREIAQTRLFAERALYVAQKMPLVLRWQAELLSVQAMDLAPVRQLVTNATQITASVDRVSRVAEQLPGQVRTEREEIVKALQAQEENLTPLVGEVRQTLTAGSEMSTSLNTTLTTFDALMKRFGVGETNSAGPPATNSAPFRIQDYGETATQLGVTARQLTELVRALDQTLDATNLSRLSEQVGPVLHQAQTGGKEIVDYAFGKGLLLVALALAAGLTYRFLGARMAARGPKARPASTS